MKQVICFLFLIYVEIITAVTPKILKQFIKNTNTVSVNIEQTKYIRALDKYIKSNSTAKFDKTNETIKWSNSNNSCSFVSTKKAYKINNGGNKNLCELPYFSDIKEIMDEVLSGNIGALDEVFDVTYSNKLILVPTISEISEQISKILINLDEEKLISVEIYYRNGDRVLLNFSQESSSNNADISKQN